ncbi:MAG: SpoIIE family protein phosphatase [Lentisphaeria bacterium]|nr:SpoIIE family protein phosphatase [Lentisphaeria bacterium]
MNVTIVAASGLDDAREHLMREKFDAVITDVDRGIPLRREIRRTYELLPVLFTTSAACWSDARLLDRIAEDPHSYCIPENADRAFVLAKLNQAITSCQAESSLNQVKTRTTRNWFLASLLQQAMLPPWVYFSENYEFSCLYRPFTKVSGALFCWLPLDENRVLFVFGDVSGHDTHSALAMTAVQSFLSQIFMRDKERAAHPSLIASDINDFFGPHLHNIVHMSTLIAFVDFGRNCIRYQNAGYMDVICLNAENGDAVNINPQGRGSVPIGLVKDQKYSEADDVEYRFSDSDVFLFCSDGVLGLSKDRDGRKFMDMEMCRRLASMLVKDCRREERSIALPFRCLHSLEQFGYMYPQDDFSLILVRKPLLNEHEYVFSCRVPADKAAVDRICEKASAFVTRFYGDESLSVSTEPLLEEFLVNVIMHGLSEYEKLNEYMAIKLCAYRNELKVIVWDHGKAWSGEFLMPDKAEQSLEQLNDDMACSGRGIPIISKIASKISRKRYCDLNETVFVIPRIPSV